MAGLARDTVAITPAPTAVAVRAPLFHTKKQR
jgi:hypothetical protein